jgi:hypothetical protein
LVQQKVSLIDGLNGLALSDDILKLQNVIGKGFGGSFKYQREDEKKR